MYFDKREQNTNRASSIELLTVETAVMVGQGMEASFEREKSAV